MDPAMVVFDLGVILQCDDKAKVLVYLSEKVLDGYNHEMAAKVTQGVKRKRLSSSSARPVRDTPSRICSGSCLNQIGQSTELPTLKRGRSALMSFSSRTGRPSGTEIWAGQPGRCEAHSGGDGTMSGSLSFTRGRRRLVRHSRQRYLVEGRVRSRVDEGSVIVGSVLRPGSGDRKA